MNTGVSNNHAFGIISVILIIPENYIPKNIQIEFLMGIVV